jgi:hypothetical protein
MFCTKLRESLRCAAIVVTLLVGTACSSLTQTSPASVADVKSTTAEIVQARTLTSQYVLWVHGRFKNDSKEYTRAYDLYAKAYANYSSWNIYVTSAIRAGQSKHLANDQKYKTVAATATQSATVFNDFVQKQMGSDRAISTVITALADLGIDIWTKCSSKITADRVAAATAFAADTKWQSWSEIIAASGTSNPLAQPKSSPPTSN